MGIGAGEPGAGDILIADGKAIQLAATPAVYNWIGELDAKR